MLRRWVTPGVFVTLAVIGVACESSPTATLNPGPLGDSQEADALPAAGSSPSPIGRPSTPTMLTERWGIWRLGKSANSAGTSPLNWLPLNDILFSPNPPKDTDGRREDSGRGWVRELQGRWPGVLG